MSTRTRILGLIASLMAYAIVAVGLAAPPAAAATLGSFAGKVIVPAGFAGKVPQMTVELRLSLTSGLAARTSVGSDGTFSISRTEVGMKYHLIVVTPTDSELFGGYVTAVGTLGGRAEAAALTPRTGMKLTLVKPRALTGTVVLPDGTQDVLQRLVIRTGPHEGSRANRADPVKPRSDGQFTVPGLNPNAEYDLELRIGVGESGVIIPGFYADDSKALVGADDAKGARPGTPVTLRPMRSLAMAGVLVAPDGYTADLTQVRITVDGYFELLDWSSAVATNVAADGSFRVVGLRPGEGYVVHVSDGDGDLYDGILVDHAGTIEQYATSFPIEARDDLVLRPRRWSHATGRVELPEGLVGTPGAATLLDALELWPAGATESRRTWITDSGTYNATIGPGGYRLCVNDPTHTLVDGCYADGESGLVPLDRATVLTGDSDLVLRPSQAVSMSGSFADVPRRDHLDGECAVAAHGLNVTAGTWTHRTCGEVEPDGTFQIGGLEPDEPYRIWLEPSSELAGGYLTDESGALGLGSQALELTPRAGVLLAPRPAVTISGTIRTPWNPDAGDREVRVHDADGVVVAKSAVREEFTFTTLSPGQGYTIELADRGHPQVNGFYASENGGLVAHEAAVPIVGPAVVTLWPDTTETYEGSVLSPYEGSWDLAVVTLRLLARDNGSGIWSEVARQKASASGGFAFAPVRYGLDYRLEVSDGSGAFIDGFLQSDGTFGPLETADDVRPGGVRVISLALPQERQITAVTGPSVPLAAVGTTLTANPGTWSVPGVRLRYQWVSDGEEVLGETSSRYKVTASDLGTALYVRVTATKDGHATATATSAVRVVTAGTLVVKTRPEATGTPEAGRVLRASRGSWSATPTVVHYQWLRNGESIRWADGPTYRPTGEDVGKRLSVRVTVGREGYRYSHSVSASTANVRRSTPKVTVKLSTKDATTKTNVKVTVRVTAPGDPGIGGRIRVRYGSQSKSMTITPDREGVMVFTLHRRPVGTYRVIAEFTPTGWTAEVTRRGVSSPVTFRVR